MGYRFPPFAPFNTHCISNDAHPHVKLLIGIIAPSRLPSEPSEIFHTGFYYIAFCIRKVVIRAEQDFSARQDHRIVCIFLDDNATPLVFNHAFSIAIPNA